MSDLISRQAAIEVVDAVWSVTGDKNVAKVWDQIKDLPSAQSEQPFEIQEILDYLDTALHPIISPEHWNVYSELHDMISTLPSAQPERKKGNEKCSNELPCGWCSLFDTPCFGRGVEQDG